jgi:hypothetical protein
MISNGKMLGTLDLQPSTVRNLEAFAKTNRVSLTDMVDRCIRFTTDPENRQTTDGLKSPEGY